MLTCCLFAAISQSSARSHPRSKCATASQTKSKQCQRKVLGWFGFCRPSAASSNLPITQCRSMVAPRSSFRRPSSRISPTNHRRSSISSTLRCLPYILNLFVCRQFATEPSFDLYESSLHSNCGPHSGRFRLHLRGELTCPHHRYLRLRIEG